MGLDRPLPMPRVPLFQVEHDELAEDAFKQFIGHLRVVERRVPFFYGAVGDDDGGQMPFGARVQHIFQHSACAGWHIAFREAIEHQQFGGAAGTNASQRLRVGDVPQFQGEALKVQPIHARRVANDISGQRPSQEGLAGPFGAAKDQVVTALHPASSEQIFQLHSTDAASHLHALLAHRSRQIGPRQQPSNAPLFDGLFQHRTELLDELIVRFIQIEGVLAPRFIPGRHVRQLDLAEAFDGAVFHKGEGRAVAVARHAPHGHREGTGRAMTSRPAVG